MSAATTPTFHAIAWQIVILTLSVVTLVFVAIDSLFAVTTETSHLFFVVDTAICLVFLGDVAYRGLIHPDRRRFWRWGWIDLLSSIPAIAILRWGRLIRVIRIIRVLRAFRSTRAIVGHLFRDPARGSVFTIALATFTLITFGSIGILNLESHHEAANIRTASDALWWSFVTVTTVGYGDHYPITTAGRLIAAVLMVTGVGLFGTLTAYLANAWLARAAIRNRDLTSAHLDERIDALEARLDELERSRSHPEASQTDHG